MQESHKVKQQNHTRQKQKSDHEKILVHIKMYLLHKTNPARAFTSYGICFVDSIVPNDRLKAN